MIFESCLSIFFQFKMLKASLNDESETRQRFVWNMENNNQHDDDRPNESAGQVQNSVFLDSNEQRYRHIDFNDFFFENRANQSSQRSGDFLPQTLTNNNQNRIITNHSEHQTTNTNFGFGYNQYHKPDTVNPTLTHKKNFQSKNFNENSNSAYNNSVFEKINSSKARQTNELIYIQDLSTPIKHELSNLWSSFVKTELKNTYKKLFNYFEYLDYADKWEKLDENSEIFDKDIMNKIEIQKSHVSIHIRYFRKPSFQKNSPFKYDYLIVKGEPDKDLRGLLWRGNKNFVMDSSNIGKDVCLMGNTYIGEGCKIGDNVSFNGDCFLKNNVTIEKNTFIGKNNYFGEGCEIGFNMQNGKILMENIEDRTKTEILNQFNYIKKNSITFVGNYNFFADKVFIPHGLNLGDEKYYSYK